LAEKFYDRYDLSVLLSILAVFYDYKREEDKKAKNTGIFPENLIKGITKKAGLSTIGALMRRVRRLQRMGVFGLAGTPLTEIVKKNQLTVIDLSEAEERVSETILSALCRGIFDARRRHVKGNGEAAGVTLKCPTFLIVEEAHNFAPNRCGNRGVNLSVGA